MRLCPTVEGSPSPLIRHRIGAEACQAQQRAHFHKCHRCVYRGKAADWTVESVETDEAAAKGSRPGTNGVAGKAAARPASGKTAKPAPVESEVDA